MTAVNPLEELIQNMAVACLSWFEESPDRFQLKLVETVPQELCRPLADAVHQLIERSKDQDSTHIEIRIFSSGVSLKELEKFEVNEDRATELRNRVSEARASSGANSVGGLSVFLLVPPGVIFPSISSAFEILAFGELLRRAAKLCCSDSKFLDGEVLEALGIDEWLDGEPIGNVDSMGLALLAVLAASGASRAVIGRNLWRIGLIPDVGGSSDDRGFIDRLADNRRTVKALVVPGANKRVQDRLLSVGVGITPVTKAVISILDRRPLSLPTGVMGWCRSILKPISTADEFGSTDDLTFDKWDFGARSGALKDLRVKPFREPGGSVVRSSKLKQDPPNSFSEPLYSVLSLNSSGDPVRPPSVVVEWETVPAKTDDVATWEVSLVVPSAYREADDQPLIVKRVKASARKHGLRLVVGLDDLPDSVSGSLLVAIQISALVTADGGVLKLATGRPAVVESDEFEIRFESGATDVNSMPSRDDAVSPAEAVLSLVADHELGDFEVVLVARPDRSVLELRFTDSGSQKLVAVRSIRTMPTLSQIQHDFLESNGLLDSARLSAQAEDPERPPTLDFESLRLPVALRNARMTFFQAVRDVEPHRQGMGAETIDWVNSPNELHEALDRYVQAYLEALSSDDSDSSLFKLDTVEINVSVGSEKVRGVALLPTHPIRALWLRTYSVQLGDWTDELRRRAPRNRHEVIDIPMVRKVCPANSPFVVVGSNSQMYVYGEELAFGYGLYLEPSDSDYDAVVSVILRALEAPRSDTLLSARVSALKRTMEKYVQARRHQNVLGIALLNPGTGELVAPILRQYFQTETDESQAQAEFLLQLTSYSDRFEICQPTQEIVRLQSDLREIGLAGLSHLSPLLRFSAKKRQDLQADTSSVHLSILQGLSRAEVAPDVSTQRRQPYLSGLITGVSSRRFLELREWLVSPATEGGSIGSVAHLHRAYLGALSRRMFGHGEGLAVKVALDLETATELKAVHERSDRVITLDRYVGIDWFQKSVELGLGTAYVLDYAPDFVEGLSDRMIVSTRHPEEVSRVIEIAMSEMGLHVLGGRTQVMNLLNIVSGRLLLNLGSPIPQAHEAVGLAVAIAVLQGEGSLDGWFIVPVDSHLEIFGPGGNVQEESGRRCDLLLVRIGDSTVYIRCIEVKERRSLPVGERLRRRVAAQLESTERILESRFFSASSDRIDRELQIAHLSSILHHYVDKSADHGLLSVAQSQETHEQISNLGSMSCEITKEAYVVSLMSLPQPADYIDDIKLRVLTESDLRSTSLTSEREFQTRTSRGSTGVDAPRDESGRASPSVAASERPTGGAQPSEEVGPIEKTGNMRDDASEVDSTGSLHEGATSRGNFKGGQSSEISSTVENGSSGSTSIDPEPYRSDTGGIDLKGCTSASVELGVDPAGQKVFWNISTKGSPHAFVLGITGQGKSVSTRHVIASLAEQGLPSLVIDLHGDMASRPPAGAAVQDVRSEGLGFNPFHLTEFDPSGIVESAYELAEVFSYVCGFGPIQEAHVFKAVKEVYARKGWVNGERGESLPTIEEFSVVLQEIEKGSKGRNATERLIPLTDFGLFRAEGGRFDPRGNGTSLVVDLHSFKLENVTWAATALILRKVYRDMFLWPQDSTLKLAIVLDEAHRIVKDPTLPKLMKEGRKYGVVCFVASQSISDFDQEVVNNAGTKIVFRTNFPESRSVAGLVRGTNKDDFAREIEGLRVGEAFVTAHDLPRARRCRMNGGQA